MGENPQKKNMKKKKIQKPVVKTKTNSKWIYVILGIVAIVMFPVMKTTFLNYDDDIYITENPLITNFDIKGLFTSIYEGQYSPFAMMIGAIQYKIFGNSPKGFKFISILIHLINTFLVYFFILKLTKKEKWALISAVLFGLHPMQIESVAWAIASMKIGMYVLLFLGAAITYLKYIDTKDKKYLIYTGVLFLLSAMSKEQAIALVPTLLLIDYYKGRNLKAASVWLEKIPFFIIGAIFGYVTLSASSGDISKQIIFDYSAGERLLFTFYTFGAYAIKILIPYKLSFFYTYPIQGETPIYFYILALIPFIVLYVLFKSIKSGNKLLTFGILFFILNVFLTLFSQILSVRDVLMADRYVYLPLIGGFLIFAYFVDKYSEKLPFLQYGVYGLAGIFAVMSFLRIGDFKNSKTIFTDVIEKEQLKGKKNPFLALPYNNRGIYLKRKGKFKEAEADYLAAIAANPKYASGFLNLANVYFAQQQNQKALANYNKSIELDKNNEKAYSSRAAVYGRLGKINAAFEDVSKALKINPNYADALLNRATIYDIRKDYQNAINDCQKYLKLRPNNKNAQQLLNSLSKKLGK